MVKSMEKSVQEDPVLNSDATMKIVGKTIFKYIAVFFVTVLLLTGALYFAAKIPKNTIRKHMLESAEYLYGEELFGSVISFADSSMIDKYADSILLNIAWNYDSKYTMRSIMLSGFYFFPNYEENENLLVSVRDGNGPTQQYLRYWHGSIAIVRPLLTIMSIKGIYVLNATVLVLLFAALIVTLLKMKEAAPALGLTLGVVMTSWWFVPLSLEYTWCCVTALAAALVAIVLVKKEKSSFYGPFFMITGMVTIFLDFLTTELLTLLIPLLIILWLDRKKDTTVKTAARAVITWGIGYSCMWIMKWILTGIVFGENPLPYVTGHIEERLGGDMGISLPVYLYRAVSRNTGTMFPFDYGIPGMTAGIILLAAAVCYGIFFRRDDFDKKLVFVLAVLGMLPFVRFLVLHNHSLRHSFFVHRVLAATVLAVILILSEITGSGTGRRNRWKNLKFR